MNVPSILTHKHDQLKLAAMEYAVENGFLESCDNHKTTCDLRETVVVARHGLLVNIVS